MMKPLSQNKTVLFETYVMFASEDDKLSSRIREWKKGSSSRSVLVSNRLGETIVKLVSPSNDQMSLIRNEFLNAFGDAILAGPNKTLEQEFFDTLTALNFTVATAESVTGGLIASRVLSQPGASRILKESYITYANEAKQKILNIDPCLFKLHGAVSIEVAGEMAKNAEKLTNSNVVIATTGYAGPTGGTLIDPVGTIYFGFAISGNVATIKKTFAGTRSQIRNNASAFALAYVIDQLKKKARNS